MLTLIISNSGSLQDGLLALTTTIPHISAVLVAENIDTALKMIENHQPVLVILEISLQKEQDVIKQIKTRWSQIHLIALVEDMTHKMEVRASGADSVLAQGFTTHKLLSIIEEIERANNSTDSENTDR
jgi:DNA-binding response OmpR family regulator